MGPQAPENLLFRPLLAALPPGVGGKRSSLEGFALQTSQLPNSKRKVKYHKVLSSGVAVPAWQVGAAVAASAARHWPAGCRRTRAAARRSCPRRPARQAAARRTAAQTVVASRSP